MKEGIVFHELTDELLDLTATRKGIRFATHAKTETLCCSCSCTCCCGWN